MQKAPQFALNRGASCCYFIFPSQSYFSIIICWYNLLSVGNPLYLSAQCFCHIAAPLSLFQLLTSACDRWSPCHEIHQIYYPCTSFINSLSLILASFAASVSANKFFFTKAINVSCIPWTLPSALSSRPRSCARFSA